MVSFNKETIESHMPEMPARYLTYEELLSSPRWNKYLFENDSVLSARNSSDGGSNSQIVSGEVGVDEILHILHHSDSLFVPGTFYFGPESEVFARTFDDQLNGLYGGVSFSLGRLVATRKKSHDQTLAFANKINTGSSNGPYSNTIIFGRDGVMQHCSDFFGKLLYAATPLNIAMPREYWPRLDNPYNSQI